MRIKKYVSICTILALSALFAGIASAEYQVGDHVADFTLTNAFGQQVSLYDYAGMTIMLTFWTST
jgi:hypothetical protein